MGSIYVYVFALIVTCSFLWSAYVMDKEGLSEFIAENLGGLIHQVDE